MKILSNIDKKYVGSLLLDMGKIVFAGLVISNLGKDTINVTLFVWGVIIVVVTWTVGLILKGGE